MNTFKCGVCGYTYDTSESFVPEHYRCPICNADQSCFKPKESVIDVINNDNNQASKQIIEERVARNNKVQQYASKNKFDEKQFVSDLYYLETEQRTLNLRINQIRKNITAEKYIPNFQSSSYYSDYKKNEKPLPSKPKKHEQSFEAGAMGCGTAGFGIALGVAWFVVLLPIAFVLDLFGVEVPDWVAIGPGCVITGIGILYAIFGSVSEVKGKHAKDHAYNQNMEEYEFETKRIKQINQTNFDNSKKDYDKYVEKKHQEIAVVVPKMELELSKAQAQYREVQETLKTLYSLKLNGEYCIHPHYQGLEAVSVIYGYFDTGRCSQLKGHEGAYNLFADEVQKKMIMQGIENLSVQMANGFNQLNDSIRYVGMAIDSCQNQLDQLQSNSNSVIRQLKQVTSNQNYTQGQLAQIADTTANTEYYAKLGAEMTTINTFYNILKD